MKKLITLLALMCLMVTGAWADVQKLHLAFSNFTTTGATVSVTDQSGTAVAGVSASVSQAVQNGTTNKNFFTTGDGYNDKVLGVQYDNHQNDYWEVTFTITGLSSFNGREIPSIDVCTPLLNSVGAYQGGDTRRTWERTLTVDNTQYGETLTGAIVNDNGHEVWNHFENASATISGGQLVLKVKMQRTDPNGCFSGVKYIDINMPTEPEAYSVNFDKSTLHTRTERNVTAVKLGDQTISVTPGGTVYQDLTANTFTITQGADVQPSMTYAGTWMHGLVYVDTDATDFQFTESELVSNTELTGSPNVATGFSTFRINTPGTYRMRYKLDWASKDPGGASDLIANGGYVIDVTLVVEAAVAKDYTVHIVNAPTGTKVTYNEEEYGNGDVIENAILQPRDIEAPTFEDLTLVGVTITGTDIYVTYSDYKVVFETPSSGVPYRIPAVAQAQNGDLIFVSDYRHSHADIGQVGNGELDLKVRKKKANGTWEDEKILQRCITTTPFTAFGDPCIVVDNTPGNPGKVMVTSCCGNVGYTHGSHSNHQGWARWYSTDNGDTWSDYEDISEQVMKQVDQRTGAKLAAFFIGSGKISQSKTIKVNNYNRLYCASLTSISPDGADANKTEVNYVWYSDDFGETWHMLGNADGCPIYANGCNEPKAEELPDGSVLISSRTGGGRIYNIWHYTDTEAGEGYWGTQQKCSDTYGANCNGEILVVPVTRASNSEKTYLLLQSIPADGQRNYVSIYWKELTNLTKYRTAAELSNGGWMKFPVSTTTSAYSTMCQMQDGHIAFYYEENSHNDGYDMVYKNFSVEEITGNAYSYSTLNATEKATYLTNGVGTYFDGESSEVQALATTYKTTPSTENYDALNAALQNPDDLFFTPGLYQIQVGSGTAQNHATYKDYYLFDNRSNNSTWPIGLTPDASVESTYVYIWGSHDNWHMEFNHGKDNSYYVGTDSKVAASAGNLSFIPNADKTEWKIWGGNTNRWIGWNLNGPAIGVSSKNEDANNNCYFIFTKVEEEDIPTAGKVYTIKANFPDQYTDLYLAHNGSEKLQFNTSATDVTNYWVARASGEERPWKFQSGYGDGNYLDGNSNNAISTTGAAYNVGSSDHGFHMQTNLTGISYAGLKYVGTWESGTKYGYGKYNGAYGNNDNYGQWTAHYEIKPVPNVTVYDVVCETTDGGVAPAFANYAGVATVKNGGIIIVPNGTTLNATNFPAAEISGYTGSVSFNGTTITVTYEATVTHEGFHIYESNGTYSNTASSSEYKDKWLSTDTDPQFTILVTGGGRAANNMYHSDTYADSGILCYTGNNSIGYTSTMTVSVQSGYKITGYTFKVKNLEGETSSHGKVVTTAGQTINTTAANQTVEVSGLHADNFTITLDGSTGSYNEGIVFTDFYVTYEGEPVVEVPATGIYYIYDNNKSGYLYNNSITSEGTSELTETLTGTKVTDDNRYLWRVVSDGSSTSITLTNGQGTGYKVSDADETHTVDLESVNWKFEELEKVHILKTDTYEYPAKFVKVRYCSYAERENVLEEGYAIYKRSTPDQYAYNNGFFVNDDAYWTVGDDVSAVFGYGDMSSINHPEDNLPFTQCRIFTRADEIENAFHFYYYTQQDAERYLKIIDNYYQVFYEHVGDPGYCKELNEDYVDESGLIDAISEMMQNFGQMGEEYKMTREEIIASAEMWLGEMLEPFEAKYSLGRLNDYIKTLEIAPPVQGEAYRIAVRGNDYTGNTKYYLKNDGTYTANEADADVFVLGGSGDETCGSLLVTNNNPGTEGGIHYLQVRADGVAMNTEYKEADNALNLVSMTKAEGENIQSCPAYLYGTFSATNKNGKVLTFDETGGGSWISDAESLYMKDNKTSAIELIPVEYPYNKPKFAVGNPDDHEGGYASIWLPYPMVFPEGVEAYRATNVENDGILILTKVNEDTNTVAAGGYILYTPEQGEDTDPDNLPLVLPAPADPEDVTPYAANAFVGSTENPLVVKEEGSWATFKAKYEGTAYVLARKNNVIGYYKYRETETCLPKGKAIWFSNYKADSSAECLRFTFEEVISAIEALHGNTDKAEIYDLQGHRLNKVEKGQVNVINGKKVMFK